MNKKKMHHLYLHIARALITFAPFLVLIIQTLILTFSQGDFGFEWSSFDTFGYNDGWFQFIGDILNVGDGSGVFALLRSCFGSLFALLGLSYTEPWVYFLEMVCSWLVLSQLIYFVVWVFDWLIDFMMDLIDMFKEKVSRRHE